MILLTRHLDMNLTTLGNRFSSLINPIYVVWMGMWFSLETYLLKSCLGNEVRTTTLIYHQFIVLPLMCNIDVEYTRPTQIFVTNSCVWAPNNT